jgi:hypothetical protein
LNADGLGKKGRHHLSVPLKVLVADTIPVMENLRLDANVIDDFSKLSASDKAKAPSAQIPSTWINFGKVEDKGGILGIAGKVSQTLEIRNEGKSPLSIYSLSADDDRIDGEG